MSICCVSDFNPHPSLAFDGICFRVSLSMVIQKFSFIDFSKFHLITWYYRDKFVDGLDTWFPGSINVHLGTYSIVYAKVTKNNVKYKRTDALSLWHKQYSTTVDIHGPLKTRGETRCPGGVSVSSLASRTRHEVLLYYFYSIINFHITE